jgi:hypothetical protein
VGAVLGLRKVNTTTKSIDSTITLFYDPPSSDDCGAVANGTAVVSGQENTNATYIDLDLIVKMKFDGCVDGRSPT